MPKVLCMTGIVVSILVMILFTADLIFGLAGLMWLAPFSYANKVMDVIFMVCAGALGFLSWTTLREQD